MGGSNLPLRSPCAWHRAGHTRRTVVCRSREPSRRKFALDLFSEEIGLFHFRAAARFTDDRARESAGSDRCRWLGCNRVPGGTKLRTPLDCFSDLSGPRCDLGYRLRYCLEENGPHCGATQGNADFRTLSYLAAALRLIRLGQKAVAHSAHCKQMARLSRILFDIAPQPHDEIIDRASVGVFVQTPNVFQNRLPRNYASLISDKMTQQHRLHHCQVNHVRAGAEFQRSEIDALAVKGKCSEFIGAGSIIKSTQLHTRWSRRFFRSGLLPRLLPLAPPHQSLQPCQKNRQVERLGQVVVGACSKPLQHILRTAPGSQHQHRHIVTRCSQLGNHAESILARKHNVEYDRVEILLFRQQALGGRLAIAHHFGGVAFGFEVKTKPLSQMSFVFHYEHAAHAIRLGSSMVTVVPRPSPSLSAKTLPPCFFAMARTMNNPRPVPFTCATDRCETR